jgi:hypothetical protein
MRVSGVGSKPSADGFLLAYDLFGKPASAFPDYALCQPTASSGGGPEKVAGSFNAAAISGTGA